MDNVWREFPYKYTYIDGIHIESLNKARHKQPLHQVYDLCTKTCAKSKTLAQSQQPLN